MRISFSPENKSKDTYGYPKLMLDKDEPARIALMEEPVLRFVHSINKPLVDPVTGEHAKETKKNSKGEEYAADAYDFVANLLCTGSPEVIQDPANFDRIDPENCLLCKATAENIGKFKSPQPKYAAHVIRYKTQPGTVTPQEPFQADLLLWVLNSSKFDKIVDLAQEHGDPRKVDLILSGCKSKIFQNYEISPGTAAFWLQTPDRVAFVQALYAGNKADDAVIYRTIGREMPASGVQGIIDQVMERWNAIGKPQVMTMVHNEFQGVANASRQMAAESEESAWSFAQPQATPAQPAMMAEVPPQPAQAQPPTWAAPEVPVMQAPAQPQPAQAQPPTWAAPEVPVMQAPAQPQPVQEVLQAQPQAAPAQAPQPQAQPAQQTAGGPSFEDILNGLGG